MESKDVIRILDEAVLARGCVPEFIRSDNGPEFVALAVQDWIARRLAHPPASLFPSSSSAGSRRSTSSPAARGRMRIAKASSCRFRDGFLNREAFASVLEAKVLGQQHRHWPNQERPPSSRDDQTPAEFAQRSLPHPPDQHQPILQKPTKTLIASGSRTGGRPGRDPPAFRPRNLTRRRPRSSKRKRVAVRPRRRGIRRLLISISRGSLRRSPAA